MVVIMKGASHTRRGRDTVHRWEDNPLIDLNDPSTFIGNYKLISMTDKTGDAFGQAGVTFSADQPTTFQVEVNGITYTASSTISGTLTLTDTRYTVSTSIIIAVPVLPTETSSDTDTGTYMITGSSITIDSDDSDEPTITATITANGNRMTIEDTDSRIVYEKLQVIYEVNPDSDSAQKRMQI